VFETQIPRNLNHDQLHVQGLGEHEAVEHVHGFRKHHLLVDREARHGRPQDLFEGGQDFQVLVAIQRGIVRSRN
jgi:hypothetical protein